MVEPTSEDDARRRWMVINAVRLSGLAIALTGILGLGHVIKMPEIAGYLLVAAGLFDFFVMPVMFARKWRTPDA